MTVMMILVNSDKNVVVDATLTSFVETEVNKVLGRFESQLTRVEVYLSDLNGNKPGLLDKRCQLEARPSGDGPVSVDDKADTVELAVRGAANKMKRLLESSFGRAQKRA
jgi:hypothetical protein